MSTADNLNTIAENVPKVFEAGKEAERRAFWEVFQNGGNRTNWQYAFFSVYWDDRTYNPIYSMTVGNTNNNMFYNTSITDTKVSIDISGTTLNYTFRNAGIVTMPELIVDETTVISNGFSGASALQNITITGTFGNSVSMSSCPLIVESMKNIISALKDYSTESPFTYTLTLKDSCKTALESDTETVELNGATYTYFELITAKGWNLA